MGRRCSFDFRYNHGDTTASCRGHQPGAWRDDAHLRWTSTITRGSNFARTRSLWPYNMHIIQGIDLENPFRQCAIVFEAAHDTHTHMWQYSSRDPFCFKQFSSARSTEYITLEHGKYYGLDYRVWGNLSLQAFPAPITSTSPMAFGLCLWMRQDSLM